MFSRKWKFEGSCTKKLDQKWKFAEMEIWVRIFCKRGRNGIPFYREWTVLGSQRVVGYDLTQVLESQKFFFLACGALQCSLKMVLRVQTQKFSSAAKIPKYPKDSS